MTEPLSYSISEAAEALGVSRSALYGLIQHGKIRSVLVGKRRLIAVYDLRQFLGVPPDAATSSQDSPASTQHSADPPLPFTLRPSEETETYLVTVRRVRSGG